jgi:hypothetical protein
MNNEPQNVNENNTPSDNLVIRLVFKKWNYAPEYAYLEQADANECDTNPDCNESELPPPTESKD